MARLMVFSWLVVSCFAADASAQCAFGPGEYGLHWGSEADFQVATTSAQDINVNSAVDWLQDHLTPVALPSGPGVLVTFLDLSFPPAGAEVAYLHTDNLWAAHALIPYDSAASEQLTNSLLGAGRYGNGINEVLFHAVTNIKFYKRASDDQQHGQLLGTCNTDTGVVNVYDFNHVTGPSDELVANYIDLAVYGALQLWWAGDHGGAQRMIADAVNDTRAQGTDLMFWDGTNRVLVDTSTRGDYDDGRNGYTNASYKLGLVIYALRLMSLGTPELLVNLRSRLQETQTPSGGIAHQVLYDENWRVVRPTDRDATGEATSIGIMALSVRAE